MADESRAAEFPLTPIDELRQQPYRFEFFAALRWLECLYSDQPRIGAAVLPTEEPIRLGQDCAMAFPPASLTTCQDLPAPAVMQLNVAFLGLFGPHGPLPLHLTEYALERVRSHKDHTLLGFADMFHHRLLTLFYRSWASAQPTVNHDRPEQDRFGDYLASLCGLGLPSLRHRDAMQDKAKLYFAGRLASVAKNAEGLEAMITRYLLVTTRLSEFIGEWIGIEVADRCRLGASPRTGSLGQTAIIGVKAFECQYRFRIHIGPLSRERFEQFLPGGPGLPALLAVVRNYLGDELQWDVQLILLQDEVPALVLGQTGQLGWTTWLGHRPAGAGDAADLVLTPLARMSAGL